MFTQIVMSVGVAAKNGDAGSSNTEAYDLARALRDFLRERGHDNVNIVGDYPVGLKAKFSVGLTTSRIVNG